MSLCKSTEACVQLGVCPRLHLWPLGDFTDRDQSQRDVAQVRFMAASQKVFFLFSPRDKNSNVYLTKLKQELEASGAIS